MNTIGTGHGNYPVRKWSELSPKEKEKFGNDEHRYVDSLIIQGIIAGSSQGSSAPGDQARGIIDNYYDRKETFEMKKLCNTPFRLNTAFMSGVSALGKIGAAVGALTAIPLAGVAGLQLIAGIKAHDRAVITDGAFNLGIAAVMGTAIFASYPLTLGALALCGVREVYMHREALGDRLTDMKDWIKDRFSRS